MSLWGQLVLNFLLLQLSGLLVSCYRYPPRPLLKAINQNDPLITNSSVETQLPIWAGWKRRSFCGAYLTLFVKNEFKNDDFSLKVTGRLFSKIVWFSIGVVLSYHCAHSFSFCICRFRRSSDASRQDGPAEFIRSCIVWWMISNSIQRRKCAERTILSSESPLKMLVDFCDRMTRLYKRSKCILMAMCCSRFQRILWFSFRNFLYVIVYAIDL